jgi:predicted GNAT family acetyltransferase
MTLIGLVLMAGVGSKCLKHALEDADRRGLAILCLCVHLDNV